MSLTWQTAGDSHGTTLAGILSGLPPGAPVDCSRADALLALRAGGFGRSRRQRMEGDQVAIQGGANAGCATGDPLLVAVENAARDHHPRDDWRVRPGHADLTGSLRTGLAPQVVAERASGRETAVRVALGGVALGLLAGLGVEVRARTLALGAVAAGGEGEAQPDDPLLWPEPATREAALEAVRAAGAAGTTLGGRARVEAVGLPPGVGEADHPEARLSARWPAALFSIPLVRAVALGAGLEMAAASGAEALDLPLGDTNRAGGLEGGRTTGRPLVARLWVKPVPTQGKPLPSVDLATGEPALAPKVRGDVTVVPAVAVVAQAVTGLVLLQAVASLLGRGTWEEWQGRWAEYRGRMPSWYRP